MTDLTVGPAEAVQLIQLGVGLHSREVNRPLVKYENTDWFLSVSSPFRMKIGHPSTRARRNYVSIEFLAKPLHSIIVITPALSSMVEEESLEFTYETCEHVFAKE